MLYWPEIFSFFFNAVADFTFEGPKKLYLYILEIKDSLTVSFDEF